MSEPAVVCVREISLDDKVHVIKRSIEMDFTQIWTQLVAVLTEFLSGGILEWLTALLGGILPQS